MKRLTPHSTWWHTLPHREHTRSIALTRALVRRHGWRVPTGSAETFSRRVVALPLPGRLLSEVAPLLAVMRHVNQQLAYSEGVPGVEGAAAVSQNLSGMESVMRNVLSGVSRVSMPIMRRSARVRTTASPRPTPWSPVRASSFRQNRPNITGRS